MSWDWRTFAAAIVLDILIALAALVIGYRAGYEEATKQARRIFERSAARIETVLQEKGR